jgi:hypothetical protein
MLIGVMKRNLKNRKMKKVEDLTQMSHEELMNEQKNRKTSFTTIAVIMVAMIGVSVMNFFAGNSFIFSIFPLFFLPIILKNQRAYAEVKKEVEMRENKG